MLERPRLKRKRLLRKRRLNGVKTAMFFLLLLLRLLIISTGESWPHLGYIWGLSIASVRKRDSGSKHLPELLTFKAGGISWFFMLLSSAFFCFAFSL